MDGVTASDSSKRTNIQTTMQLVDEEIKRREEKKRGKKDKAGWPYIQLRLSPNKERDDTGGANSSNSANKVENQGDGAKWHPCY